MYDTKEPRASTLGNNVVDQASMIANQGIDATHEALDGLAGGVQSLRDSVSPRLDGVTERASMALNRGIGALRDSSQQLRAKAQQASEGTTQYIQQEPVKAVLIAAAMGAALMVLIGLMTRSRRDG
jgi:ElaB/YqjD/DUF883 family membrane-anchored ribosome-binding protein